MESITTIKTCISLHFIIILLSASIHTLFTLFYFYLLFIFSHFIYHSSFHSLQLRFTIFGSRSIQILISYLHFYLYIWFCSAVPLILCLLIILYVETTIYGSIPVLVFAFRLLTSLYYTTAWACTSWTCIDIMHIKNVIIKVNIEMCNDQFTTSYCLA